MKIQINDHRKIFTLQKQFRELFPDLKIEFLGKPSKVGNPPASAIVNNTKTLGQCRVQHNKGELTLTPTMNVYDLKQVLADTFGLSIVFFRKEGNEWVPAS